MDSDTDFSTYTRLTSFNDSLEGLDVKRAQDPVLIFTCLGIFAFIKHQQYIWQALNQARAINPSINIVVIINKAALTSTIMERFESLNITVEIHEELTLYNSVSSDFRRTFFVQGSMEPNGNREFVQLTIERLLSIYAYMKRNTEVHTFHLENDNMLYVDLGILGKRMNDCGVNLAFPRASKNMAVLSFMYVRNVYYLEQLVKWCVDVFRLGRNSAMKFLNTQYINDMTLTAHYLKLRGATAEQSKRSGIYELPTQFIDEMSNCCVCFLEARPLIFDACVLGQYFGGTFANPNDSYWESGRLVDPRGDMLSWRPINQQLRVPYIRNQRIANLHVHSKRLEQFSSFGNQQTMGLASLSN